MTTFYRRHLPHIDAPGRPVFVTWHLHGSLPANRRFPPEITSGEAFVEMDRMLDMARTGPRYLVRGDLAEMVIESLEYRETQIRHFDLHAYAIMPNHVHMLITPHVSLSKLMQSLKRHTAREGNRMLGLRNQTFWQDESYDHLVRNLEEFERIRGYIEMNPVRAGLVCNPEEFRWSSARAD